MTHPDSPAIDSSESSENKPTRIRHFVVCVTVLSAFLLYLHRFCMSYAQRYIKEDLQLSDSQLGYCFSAFFFSYALAQVPSGWLSDRFGARRMLTLYILTWSFFTSMMGLTVGFIMLLAVRLAAGLGQAGAYPTSAALLSRWVPLTSRGKSSSYVAFGGRVGGGLAPILTSWLIIAFVPVGTSSLLSDSDILDIHPFAARFAEIDGKQVNQNPPRQIDQFLWKQFSTQTRQSLSNVFEASDSSSYPQNTYSSQDKIHLIAKLNFLIHSESFYQPDLFRDMDFETECKRLIKRSEQGLSEMEIERRNRLLLEAAYPETIRKIYGRGWRPVMLTFGSLGIIVAAVFWFCFRDVPSKHPWCNDEEVQLIDYGKPMKAADLQAEKSTVPFRNILSSRSLWLICVTHWGSNVGWVFLVTWLPKYLLDVHQIPLEQRGVMAAVPLFVGWSGMLLGGWLTDRLRSVLGLRWGRVMPIICGRFLGASAYLLCLFEPSVWAMTALFAVVAFSTDVGSASLWAYKQDVGGRNVGSIHGWSNMWGNLGATISPVLLLAVLSNFGWNAVFLTCATAFFIAGVAAMGVDARQLIVPEDDPVVATN